MDGTQPAEPRPELDICIDTTLNPWLVAAMTVEDLRRTGGP